MRNLLLLLGFVVMLTSCGSKEPKKEIIVPKKKIEKLPSPVIKKEVPKSTLLFTIQIGANKKESKTFSSVSNVKVSKEKGLFKYRLGAFKTYKEAKLYRAKIIHKYPGAFVQAMKGTEPITIQKAIK